MSNAPKPERNSGAPESKASNETFPHRRERPGDAGLANEVRPGLGTRAKTNTPRGKAADTPHDADPRGRNAPLPPAKPRPAPREQRPDTMAHELERDTGTTGHSSGD